MSYFNNINMIRGRQRKKQKRKKKTAVLVHKKINKFKFKFATVSSAVIVMRNSIDFLISFKNVLICFFSVFGCSLFQKYSLWDCQNEVGIKIRGRSCQAYTKAKVHSFSNNRVVRNFSFVAFDKADGWNYEATSKVPPTNPRLTSYYFISHAKLTGLARPKQCSLSDWRIYKNIINQKFYN